MRGLSLTKVNRVEEGLFLIVHMKLLMRGPQQAASSNLSGLPATVNGSNPLVTGSYIRLIAKIVLSPCWRHLRCRPGMHHRKQRPQVDGWGYSPVQSPPRKMSSGEQVRSKHDRVRITSNWSSRRGDGLCAVGGFSKNWMKDGSDVDKMLRTVAALATKRCLVYDDSIYEHSIFTEYSFLCALESTNCGRDNLTERLFCMTTVRCIHHQVVVQTLINTIVGSD